MYDTHICMKYVIYFFCTLLSFYNMLIVQKHHFYQFKIFSHCYFGQIQSATFDSRIPSDKSSVL